MSNYEEVDTNRSSDPYLHAQIELRLASVGQRDLLNCTGAGTALAFIGGA